MSSKWHCAKSKTGSRYLAGRTVMKSVTASLFCIRVLGLTVWCLNILCSSALFNLYSLKTVGERVTGGVSLGVKLSPSTPSQTAKRPLWSWFRLYLCFIKKSTPEAWVGPKWDANNNASAADKSSCSPVLFLDTEPCLIIFSFGVLLQLWTGRLTH